MGRPAALAALALAPFGRAVTLAALDTFGGRLLARSLVCIVAYGSKRYMVYMAYGLLSYEWRYTLYGIRYTVYCGMR